MRRFIYERSVTNIRDWSLAYFFHMYNIIYVIGGFYQGIPLRRVQICIYKTLIFRKLLTNIIDKLPRRLFQLIPY